MDSGNINANVVEGKVNRVNVVYVDDNGNPKKGGGETPNEVVERELPFHVRFPAADAVVDSGMLQRACNSSCQSSLCVQCVQDREQWQAFLVL